jgi:hypothetical protein
MVLPLAAGTDPIRRTGVLVRLFVGDDWAEDHVRREASEIERR